MRARHAFSMHNFIAESTQSALLCWATSTLLFFQFKLGQFAGKEREREKKKERRLGCPGHGVGHSQDNLHYKGRQRGSGREKSARLQRIIFIVTFSLYSRFQRFDAVLFKVLEPVSVWLIFVIKQPPRRYMYLARFPFASLRGLHIAASRYRVRRLKCD